MTSPVYDIPGYEFVRELGVGGMATVYLAIQRSLDRSVAIKVMRRAGADENFEKRFLLEGRTMAKLPHRNIVGVYDIVQNETINYIAMEYLGGGTLSDRMRQGLSLVEAISIVVQTAGALQYAHDNGVVHRDLKPANIMFRDVHTPVLTDFGIARAKDQNATRLTQTGMMIGTPTYMSPEQAMGSDVDGRSDQYSLGILFFEMLTGAPPFNGESPLNVVLAHINQPPPPLPTPFEAFQPVLDRMLAKDRELRYPDLNVFVRELKSMLIQSDTLLASLQIDPTQTASEQLRALGFSESQINTGSRNAAGPRVSAQRPAPESRQTGPGVRVGTRPAPPPPAARPRWLIPVGVAALIVAVALGAWMMFGGRDELDPALRGLVDTSLKEIDRQIAEGKLVSPPGDNANEKLQQVMQAAPELPEAIERQDRIVAALTRQAEAALVAKNFTAAELRAGEALAVAPDDADVKALRQRIDVAKIGAVREAEVAALLTAGDAALRAGRLYGEGTDTALAKVRQALEVDAQSAAARALLAKLTEQALASAKTALSEGHLDQAGALLDASAAYFASEPAWQQLGADLQKARELALQQSRIEGFLDQARNHVAAGRYAEPAGDNALESLARVAELDAGNVPAAALRREIGVALSKQASEAEKRSDLVAALESYDQALLAQPESPQYAAARSALQQRMGERDTQLAAALGNARAAINARRYLAPAGNNAREYLDAVLKLDPGNADATRLRDGLPALVRDAAAELGQEGRIDEALALLTEASKSYPADAQFTALATSLERERARLRSAEDRRSRLAEAQQSLAAGSPTVDLVVRIGATVEALLGSDPKDAEALRLRDGLIGSVSDAVEIADSVERLQALRPVVDQVAKTFGNSALAIGLQARFVAADTALQEKERARLAAISGTLVLNAYPWASVESVVDQSNGTPVPLSQDRSTPLRLTIPAGTYRVTFRHPQAGKPIALVASVQAQMVQEANATFPTLTARNYLKRAGYAP